VRDTAIARRSISSTAQSERPTGANCHHISAAGNLTGDHVAKLSRFVEVNTVDIDPVVGEIDIKISARRPCCAERVDLAIIVGNARRTELRTRWGRVERKPGADRPFRIEPVVAADAIAPCVVVVQRSSVGAWAGLS